MTTLQQLRSRIGELVPDVLKLEFGCEISRRYDMYKSGTIIGQDNGTYYVLYDSISNITETIHDIQDYEILGRDPSLADVLRAVRVDNFINIQIIYLKKS